MAYIVSLAIGGAGFIGTMFVHDAYLMFVPLILIGCAWAAMLALPFTILTNALEGSDSMGAYLGLFNCTICLPQIVAALVGGVILGIVGGSQPAMLVVAGVLILCGGIAAAFAVKRN
jgi:maltose/moltooligosaccharide transporter